MHWYWLNSSINLKLNVFDWNRTSCTMTMPYLFTCFRRLIKIFSQARLPAYCICINYQASTLPSLKYLLKQVYSSLSPSFLLNNEVANYDHIYRPNIQYAAVSGGNLKMMTTGIFDEYYYALVHLD